jgi:glycerophosphoryl diester phosphodiesterase
VTPDLVTFAHRHDVQVHVWTVNDEAEMERLLDLGVDGVMSDYPGRLRAVVDARLG